MTERVLPKVVIEDLGVDAAYVDSPEGGVLALRPSQSIENATQAAVAAVPDADVVQVARLVREALKGHGAVSLASLGILGLEAVSAPSAATPASPTGGSVDSPARPESRLGWLRSIHPGVALLVGAAVGALATLALVTAGDRVSTGPAGLVDRDSWREFSARVFDPLDAALGISCQESGLLAAQCTDLSGTGEVVAVAVTLSETRTTYSFRWGPQHARLDVFPDDVDAAAFVHWYQADHPNWDLAQVDRFVIGDADTDLGDILLKRVRDADPKHLDRLELVAVSHVLTG